MFKSASFVLCFLCVYCSVDTMQLHSNIYNHVYGIILINLSCSVKSILRWLDIDHQKLIYLIDHGHKHRDRTSSKWPPFYTTITKKCVPF